MILHNMCKKKTRRNSGSKVLSDDWSHSFHNSPGDWRAMQSISFASDAVSRLVIFQIHSTTRWNKRKLKLKNIFLSYTVKEKLKCDWNCLFSAGCQQFLIIANPACTVKQVTCASWQVENAGMQTAWKGTFAVVRWRGGGNKKICRVTYSLEQYTLHSIRVEF